jgi:hypothetical protein
VTKAKDRHGYLDWPHPAVERATEPRERPQRRRKNTKLWCKGKTGVAHVPEVRLGKYATSPWRRGTPPCYRADWSPKSWWCNHETYCTTCGKILVHSLGDRCPDYAAEVTRHRATEVAQLRDTTRRKTDDE